MRLLRRAARRKYGLDELVEAWPGEVRRLAHAINRQRSERGESGGYVHAGELSALGLLQELLFGALYEAFDDRADEALAAALAALESELGDAAVSDLLGDFEQAFEGDPPAKESDTADGARPAGRERGATRRESKAQRLPARASRAAALARLFVLWELNRNPAVAPLRELIDDRELAPEHYGRAMELLERYIRQATRGEVPLAGDLIDRLEAPLRAEPTSLAGQLQLYLDQPTEALGVPRQQVQRALDALEEERIRPPAGPGPVELPPMETGPVEYAHEPRGEPAWMRQLVLTAKHTHVWLEQLSAAAGRPIARLDQVPQEALTSLVAAGVSGLWLVGVWQRSPASREIKRRAGNADAAASAYSIFDYTVAEDLGGEEALLALQDRAADVGLRLGVDVVPNHFGLDSRWLRDHPERFLASDECPFPGYTFDGPDLSGDPAIGLFLEDHYYDRSDAAVVFKHLDRETGRERFIYHGNDGTTTPWNDTAQLDYTRPDVRQAMTELIVDLARRFRILRFDAAMTLTRLHFQRLWFPAPGSGGAVPSRSDHGMSERDFESLMPREFWLDVVETVEREGRDTLLIAEAFWLMEPYFVRQLGMHRVYNSAFMHLVRERDNARFQRLLADGLERDPEMLRRSVNFMTTPDEASAAEQFGTGDRYFGVATLLATLPGTPLLGHGQVEGLAEKYGMEYLAARSDEAPDADLMHRHARELAPLLAERRRFSDVAALRRLEFVGPGGYVWQDVYAFAALGAEDGWLVLFNNSPEAVAGVVRGEGLGALLEGVSQVVDERVGVVLECSDEHWTGGELRVELSGWQALVLRPGSGG